MKKLTAPLLLLLSLFISFNVYSIPTLNSLSGASATIYLDFDGHNVNSPFWNGGNAFTCAPAGMNDAQITEIFNRVAEDYRPFNINITTEASKYLSAPLSTRMRIVITPTSSWFKGVGGVSFTGSFKWGDDTPAFVFCDRLGPNSPKMVAECCSHESGHTVGLSHQSKYDGICNLTATYNDGTGTGVNAWAPIMGNSYYRNMTGWNNGPTPYGCASTQDNLSIITSQNGFSFRTDDYSNDINVNPATLPISGSRLDGVITTSSDQDAFKLTLPATVAINVALKPFSVDANFQGANLDIKVSLYNSAKLLIRTYDPTSMMNVTIDTVLNSGAYYLLVDGTGNGNIGDYGSLGSYSISAATSGVLPIHTVSLTGRADNNRHNLSWKIVSDEPVQTSIIESSDDGVRFTEIHRASSLSSNFVYTPAGSKDLHYRLKATTQHQTLYSNTIMLKATGGHKGFKVSTLVKENIFISTTEKYNYQLMNMSGSILAKGNGQAGSSGIDMSRLPGGMYVLQLMNDNEKQTERIIKQ
jgi:hypothetical protein